MATQLTKKHITNITKQYTRKTNELLNYSISNANVTSVQSLKKSEDDTQIYTCVLTVRVILTHCDNNDLYKMVRDMIVTNSLPMYYSDEYESWYIPREYLVEYILTQYIPKHELQWISTIDLDKTPKPYDHLNYWWLDSDPNYMSNNFNHAITYDMKFKKIKHMLAFIEWLKNTVGNIVPIFKIETIKMPLNEQIEKVMLDDPSVYITSNKNAFEDGWKYSINIEKPRKNPDMIDALLAMIDSGGLRMAVSHYAIHAYAITKDADRLPISQMNLTIYADKDNSKLETWLAMYGIIVKNKQRVYKASYK